MTKDKHPINTCFLSFHLFLVFCTFTKMENRTGENKQEKQQGKQITCRKTGKKEGVEMENNKTWREEERRAVRRRWK